MSVAASKVAHMDVGDSLAHEAGIEIITARLPGLMVAGTDGRRIYVDERLTPRERHCAIVHELVHLESGHSTCQPASIEAKVRRAAAHRLVQWDALWSRIPWDRTFDELAEDMHVTSSVLKDWIEGLSEEQMRQLQLRIRSAA